MAKRECNDHATWLPPDFSGCTSDEYTNLYENVSNPYNKHERARVPMTVANIVALSRCLVWKSVSVLPTKELMHLTAGYVIQACHEPSK